MKSLSPVMEHKYKYSFKNHANKTWHLSYKKLEKLRE
jgi:hypothetical protein